MGFRFIKTYPSWEVGLGGLLVGDHVAMVDDLPQSRGECQNEQSTISRIACDGR